VLGEAVRIGILGFFFLKVARVSHDYRRQRGRLFGREHGPFESATAQGGDHPGMIEVRVGKDNGVHRRGVERKGLPVPQAQVLEPLVHPAVDEDRPASRLHEEAASGYGARRSEKGEGRRVQSSEDHGIRLRCTTRRSRHSHHRRPGPVTSPGPKALLRDLRSRQPDRQFLHEQQDGIEDAKRGVRRGARQLDLLGALEEHL
jgi:hypothetical protein